MYIQESDREHDTLIKGSSLRYETTLNTGTTHSLRPASRLRSVIYFLLAVTASLQLVSCAPITEIRKFNDGTPIQPSAGTAPIMFRKLVSQLSRGQEIGTVQVGVLCLTQSKLYWKRAGQASVGDDELADVLKQELINAGYQVVGDQNSLFEDPQEWKAEYLIGGIVKHTAMNICYQKIGYMDLATSSGEASVEVEWQVFERRTRSVVYTAVTGGTAKTATGPHNGIQAYYDAFAKSVRNLLSDSRFVELVSRTGAPPSAQADLPLQLDVLSLTASDHTTASELISYAQSTVVTIPAGSGHGSGVIISPAGFVLTNAHVVGAGSSPVTVELATGRRVTGKVVRINQKTDVALVQLDPGKYPAAIIDTAPALRVGDSVFAVGTPLHEKFQRTVTKGIVSAFRVEDGLRSIQSDVVIHAGNSGGPLLDSNGRVVGLTRSGVVAVPGVGVGLNYFIPIEDAFAALYLTPRTTSVKPNALIPSKRSPESIGDARPVGPIQLQFEEKLRLIQELRDKKLISESEAEQRRNQLLDSLTR